MHPAEALDRIAYLLDRALEPSQRVKAYIRARDVVREQGDDEIARLHAAGRLTDLAGIGPKTAAIIEQALAGEVPSYIGELEEDTRIEPGPGAGLRAALRGDCHTHSTWSDGGATIEEMARAAIGLGHEYMVLTDHSPRLTVARGLTAERLARQLDEVEAVNERLAPFRVLTGIEVDINPDGSLDQSEEMLARLDVVVASVHSKLGMERTDMTRRMVTAVANPHVDILGHCTGRKVASWERFAGGKASGRRSAAPVPASERDAAPARPRRVGPNGKGKDWSRPAPGGGRAQAEFDAELVFAACAQFGTALEINCRPERQDPPEDLLAMAIEWGLEFSIDTDAHAPGQLEWQPYGCDKAALAGIPAERIVNTRPADELLGWAAAHAE
ncbi:MAG TPA: PHP domain-containing protein [Acidimicrobiales bacterium]|nr:PHP domain-containing protein [Acidimicrobiales bacterium]